jgi:hypothetical protein
LVGVIILIVTLFAGFKMGLFFSSVMDGNFGSRGGAYFMGSSRMMDDFYKKGSLENCASWQDWQDGVSAPSAPSLPAPTLE